MKLFECQHCGQLLYFENTRCERCGHVLGYLPDREILSALTSEGGGRWYHLAAPEDPFWLLRQCLCVPKTSSGFV
jgi:hypothetical protein